MVPTENAEQYDALAQKWINGTITREEAKVYADWYNAHSDIPLEIPASFAGSEEELRGQLLQIIQSRRQQAVIASLPGKRYTRFVAAASIAVLLALGGYLFYHVPASPTMAIAPTALPTVHDIDPGHDGAVLTLGNGKTIVLDSTGNGNIATQGGVKITKQDGRIAYEKDNSLHPGDINFNTMSTPRGHQYQLVLPDGTKVWLNAGSFIKYPTSFIGKERRVAMSGEAYFEVAKNAGMPFLVTVNNEEEVKVLGTHFNIHAYTDEATAKTTLLEGSVQLSTTGRASTPAMLAPGQQAWFGKDSRLQVVDDADLEETMAWKNGRFAFHGASLETILQQTARWYDVDVVYQDRIKDAYTVMISRNVPLSQLLAFLEKSGGVHFDIKDKTITVRR